MCIPYLMRKKIIFKRNNLDFSWGCNQSKEINLKCWTLLIWTDRVNAVYLHFDYNLLYFPHTQSGHTEDLENSDCRCPAPCSAVMCRCKEMVHPRWFHWLTTSAAFIVAMWPRGKEMAMSAVGHWGHRRTPKRTQTQVPRTCTDMWSFLHWTFRNV